MLGIVSINRRSSIQTNRPARRHAKPIAAALVLLAVFASSASAQRILAGRFNSNGSRDANYQMFPFDLIPDISEHLADAALASGGKLVAVGNANSRFYFVRFLSDGRVDTTFGSNGTVTVSIPGSTASRGEGVAIDSSGRIVAAGVATVNGESQFAAVRLTSSGAVDSTFSGDGRVTTDFVTSESEGAHDVRIQSNGKIVAVGWAERDGANSQFASVRYNTDGSLDTTFNIDGKALADFPETLTESAFSVAITSDGKIVAAGRGGTTAGGGKFAIARWTSAGSRDTTFSGDGMMQVDFSGDRNSSGQGVVIDSANRILVAGWSYDVSAQITSIAAARVLSSGAIDTSFSGDGKVLTTFGLADRNYAWDACLASGDKLVAVGSTISGPATAVAVVRYTASGALDTTFAGSGGAVVNVVANGNDHATGCAMDGTKIVVSAVAN